MDYGIDDVQYVSKLLDDLQHRLCIDARRIYATGFSNGAGLVDLLACRLAGRIAAFAPVCGDFFTLPGGCHPSRPVPLLYIHGTADPLLPYYTGVSSPDWPLPPIPQWLQQWALRDGCTTGPVIFLQQPKVTGEQWSDCKRDSIVVHYRIEGGGHA